MWILLAKSGAFRPSGRLTILILLDQVPPEAIQVLVGIVVEGLLEAKHHLAPAREDQELVAAHLRPAASKAAGSGTLTPIACSQSAFLRESLEHHRDPFGRQDVGIGRAARRARSGNVLAAIDRMAQLVQHRAHPVLVGHDVGQHAHVALAVDVGAEGVRALAGLLVEVAAGDHVVDRQTDAGVEIAAELRGYRPSRRRVSRSASKIAGDSWKNGS